MTNHEGAGAVRRPTWFKSRYSTADLSCVEIRLLPTEVQVRDSKQVSTISGQNISRVITLPTDDWRQFLRHEVGDDATAAPVGILRRITTDQGDVVLHHEETGAELVYNTDEWAAFCSGALDGEFDPPPLVD